MVEAGATCAVCGESDARALLDVTLNGGTPVTMCGSHELMHRRNGARARSVAELRTELGERRSMTRRANGDGDELADRLTAAFTAERRTAERRAG
jgi:hypothetical protein